MTKHKYVVLLSPMARNQINMMNARMKKRVLSKLKDVERDPFSHIERLRGNRRFSKVRVGDYRIILEINRSRNVIIYKVIKRPRAYMFN